MDKDNFDGNLMDLFGETNQIEVFQTKVVQDLIQFKWFSYGKMVHQIAALVHMTYVMTFLFYLDKMYLKRIEGIHLLPIIIMVICNSFAFLYDSRQLIKQRSLYFWDVWNYYDQLYIWSGFLNLYL
jgi:hypothetical protein